MEVVGIYSNNGKVTLHLLLDFAGYYMKQEEGRVCSGKAVKSVYIGDMDISGIKVGSIIDILYGEAVTTKNGAFSPIKRIEVLK